MSDYRQVICERIRYLFGRAWDQGCDTDRWDAGPDEVDLICNDAWDRQYDAALARVELQSDPRWEELRCYLQGLKDEQDGEDER